jgi:hypothetical protein
MNLFLAHVAEEFPDYFIVMQMDRAGWHDTDDLVLQRRVYETPARLDHNQRHGILSSTCFHTD